MSVGSVQLRSRLSNITGTHTVAAPQPQQDSLSWGKALGIIVPAGLVLGIAGGAAIGAFSFAGSADFYGSRFEKAWRYGAVGAIFGALGGGAVAGPLSAVVN